MSRIGKKPIPIPSGVSLDVGEAEVVVKGQRGELRQAVDPDIVVREENGQIIVERPSDDRRHRALHPEGCYRGDTDPRSATVATVAPPLPASSVSSPP